MENICTIPGMGSPEPFNPSIILPTTSNCIPCQYNVYQKNSDGSKNDFLCSVYFNKILGLFPYIRTFRRYNRQSAIIIFLDEDGLSDVKPLDKIALTDCGVTIINSGKVSSHVRGLQIIRLLYFYDYLKTCRFYFRRCIFTDGFDVFFQGDPFTSDLLIENIYLTTETETNNFLNQSYYEKFPTFYKVICSHDIVNCGVFAGGTSAMCRFFSFYLQMFPGLIAIESQPTNYRNPYSDQDALNYFIYIQAQKIPSLRNNIVLWNTSSNFASMIGEVRYGIKNVDWKFPYFSVMLNGVRKRAILVHQYTYCRELTESLIKGCGLLSHQKNNSDYYRI